jgi:signal transduction histidine kinase
MKRLGITFDSDLEKEFLTDYTEKTLPVSRLALILGILLYSLFGILDIWIVPDHRGIIWAIRYFFVCPTFIIILLITFIIKLRSYLQIVFSFAATLAGYGIILMIAFSDFNELGFKLYYAGLILVLFWVHTIIRLRFIYATVVSWIIIIGYEYVAIFTQGLSSDNSQGLYFPIFINNNFFFISANIIGMFASYSQEFFYTKDFIQRKEIEKHFHELSEANEKLNIQKKELQTILENLQRTQNQLIQSEKMASIGHLVAGIAHEINNPVNFISAGVDSLSTNLDEIKQVLDIYHKITSHNVAEKLKEINELKVKVEYKEAIREINNLIVSIKNGTKRTTEIVKGLRTFSRMDEGILKMADIHEGLDSTLILLLNKYKNRIDIIKNYGNLPLVECYAGQLNQVFMNIFSNAVDAIEGKGSITINTSISEGYIKIGIVDTGPGIPDNIRGKIFDPFFTTKEVGKGTGLGLSISQSIIEKHKGSIYVKSEQGKGTEFVISLPVKQTKE